MKRFLVVALTAILVVLASTATAVADPPGGVDPSCADINGGGAQLVPAVNPDTAQGSIQTLTATCKSVRYTVVISFRTGGVQQIATFSKKGGNDIVNDVGNGIVRFSIPLGSVADDGLACVAFFTTRGDNILDAAPDSARDTPPPTPANDCAGWVEFNTGPPGSSTPFN